MKLIRIGELIELNNEKNISGKLTKTDVVGMTITKEIIPTKANLNNSDLNKFIIIRPNDFVYNPRTHGKRIGLGFNDTNKSFLISWNNISFRVKKTKLEEINPIFLFMWFNRNEWDRNATFNSWGSSTEVFSWEEMCDMKIPLPNIKIQNKYVSIYKAMQDNLKVYQSKLNDLEITYTGYIEDLRKKYESKKINKYIELVTDSNTNLQYKLNDVMGISNEKIIIPTKANASKNDLSKFTIIKPNDFIYNPRNGVAIGLNRTKNNYIISWNNTAFRIKNEYTDKLNPRYLMMFFKRKEWNRRVRFDSWGSSTEIYSFSDLGETKVPIPSMEIQESVSNILDIYYKRKEYIEKVISIINKICPILVKGAIQEGEKEKNE